MGGGYQTGDYYTEDAGGACSSLRKKGMSAAEIAADIESVKDRLVVCGVLDTLTNLRKGGRIPPTFDVIGNALKIKPVIELKDGGAGEDWNRTGSA